MKATFYKAPHGHKEEMEISNIYPEDEQFFETNGVVISMEYLAGDFVVYADTGYENEDGDPEEFIAISAGRSCEDILKELRLACEQFYARKEPVSDNG